MTRAFTLLLLVAALLIPSRIAGQVAPPGAIAWTSCLGRTVATYIDVAILGADSTDEILYHESIHRRQAVDSLAKTGACPLIVSPAQLLNYEIEAYCASDSIHVKRDTREHAKAITLERLMREFHAALPAFTITQSWQQACP